MRATDVMVVREGGGKLWHRPPGGQGRREAAERRHLPQLAGAVAKELGFRAEGVDDAPVGGANNDSVT